MKREGLEEREGESSPVVTNSFFHLSLQYVLTLRDKIFSAAQTVTSDDHKAPVFCFQCGLYLSTAFQFQDLKTP